MRQIPLDVSLSEYMTFETFYLDQISLSLIH